MVILYSKNFAEKGKKMKYCKKCKHLHNDEQQICTNCKKPLCEISDKNTPVCLLSASGFELERIKAALEDCGIPCDSVLQRHMASAKAMTGYDTSEYDVLVPYSAYEKAYDICVGIGAIKLADEEIVESGDDVAVNSDTKTATEQFEEMSSTKRTTVRVVSALLLVIVFALVIYGTDFIAEFIKNLFS